MGSRESSVKALQKAILDLHGCKPTWIESVPVKELFEGETAWEGVVQVFDLQDHPKAKRCYAWSHSLDNSKKRKFFAVLHQGVVDSPEKAVKAAIVSEVRKLKDLIRLIQQCEHDTRRLLGSGAAQRLGKWKYHTQSLRSLVEYIEQLLWGEHCQNGKRLDQQGGLSLERIVLDHRPELFSEADLQQAKRTLGIG